MEPMNKDQQMGVILERLTDTAEAVHRLEQRFNHLEARVDDKFKTAEAVMKMLKFLGLSALAVLSFKFGDVSRLWTHFFG